MSPKLDVSRMRASKRRRWASRAMPMKQKIPAMPPTAMARPCLKPCADAERVEDPDRRQQADEMSDEDHQDADVEEVRAPAELAPAKECEEPVFQVYCSRSKRSRLPSRKTVRHK